MAAASPTVNAVPEYHVAHPIDGRRTARIHCKTSSEYSLAVHRGMVVLRLHDPRDDHQRWVKDERFNDRVTDQGGNPSFALVNKATGLAIRHATGGTRLVQLAPYSGEYFDETVLWTEGHDGDYKAIRMVNNTSLNLDAVGGNAVVSDGTLVGLYEWNGGTNQLWKITYY